MCWLYYCNVLVMRWWFLAVRWWYFRNCSVMRRWCFDDACMIFGWCCGNVWMMSRRWSDDGQMMLGWCLDDDWMMIGCCVDDVWVLLGYCLDECFMIAKKAVRDHVGGIIHIYIYIYIYTVVHVDSYGNVYVMLYFWYCCNCCGACFMSLETLLNTTTKKYKNPTRTKHITQELVPFPMSQLLHCFIVS